MIPITIVDNFLDEPQSLVDLSTTLEYQPSPEGLWPGTRSEKLHVVNGQLYDNIATRVMGLFQSLNDLERGEVDCDMSFQRVPAKFHHGWVHHDNWVYATGILYLNDNAGTSLYTRTSSKDFNENHVPIKMKSNLRGYMTEEEKEWQAEYNNSFQKEVVVKGIYNRLLMFHGNVLHSANSFETEEDDRLTLVMFFHRISGEPMPLERMRAVRKV